MRHLHESHEEDEKQRLKAESKSDAITEEGEGSSFGVNQVKK